MKRITKRILVLIFCSTLIFASVDSIYHNTFALEVQAAEVVITAGVGATLIEYACALCVAMGLMDKPTYYGDFDIETIAANLETIASNPDITDGMVFSVVTGIDVNGKIEIVEVTYSQLMEYMDSIQGSNALEKREAVLQVLNGGGGGNQDPNRSVKVLGGRLFSALVVKMITGVVDFVNSGGLSEQELQQIEDMRSELLLTAPEYAQENTVRSVIDQNGIPVFINNYHMDFIDKYDLSFDYDGEFYHNVSVGFREGSGDIHYTQIYKKYDGLVNEPCVVCLIPINVLNSGKYMRVVVVKFNLSENKWGIYGSAWGKTSSYIGTSSGVQVLGSGVFCNELNNVSLSEYENIVSDFVPFNSAFFYNRVNAYKHDFSGDSSAANIFYKNYNGVKGVADIGVYCFGTDAENYHVMPVLYCPTLSDLQIDCNKLANTALEDWDYGIFANSNERTKSLVVGSAYSNVSTDSLSDFADAMLNSDSPVSEKLEAADQIDKLRDVTPAELPELYPELYPEYAPGSADVPSTPPNPNRVVESVTTDISPNPEPSPTPAPDAGDNELNGEELSGVTFSLSEYFPFCIPFDLVRAFKLLVADAEAPRWEVPLHAEFLGYVLNYTFVIDMSQFEVLVKVFRMCETIGFCIGLLLLTRNIIRG